MLKSGLRRLPDPVANRLRKVFKVAAARRGKSGRAASMAMAQQHLKLGRAYLSHWDIMPAYTLINRSFGADYMNSEAHRLDSYIPEIMGDTRRHSGPRGPRSKAIR
jgi:hypothetical protein